MKDKIFIDTNILVYANDPSDRKKNRIARQAILEGIQKENIAISTQVISEFYVTVTRKILTKMSSEAAKQEIRLLRTIEIDEIDYHSILSAINISVQHQLSFWDSLIITSAKKLDCQVIYSEDMNSGQTIENIQIVNPFIESSSDN